MWSFVLGRTFLQLTLFLSLLLSLVVKCQSFCFLMITVIRCSFSILQAGSFCRNALAIVVVWGFIFWSVILSSNRSLWLSYISYLCSLYPMLSLIAFISLVIYFELITYLISFHFHYFHLSLKVSKLICTFTLYLWRITSFYWSVILFDGLFITKFTLFS